MLKPMVLEGAGSAYHTVLLPNLDALHRLTVMSFGLPDDTSCHTIHGTSWRLYIHFSDWLTTRRLHQRPKCCLWCTMMIIQTIGYSILWWLAGVDENGWVVSDPTNIRGLHGEYQWPVWGVDKQLMAIDGGLCDKTLTDPPLPCRHNFSSRSLPYHTMMGLSRHCLHLLQETTIKVRTHACDGSPPKEIINCVAISSRSSCQKKKVMA